MTRAVLLDENFPRAVASGLMAAGHDVVSIASLAPGLDDRSVLAMARTEQRCLLSFDGDFGELVFLRGAEPPSAILFFRLHPIVTAAVLDLTLRALDDAQRLRAILTRGFAKFMFASADPPRQLTIS